MDAVAGGSLKRWGWVLTCTGLVAMTLFGCDKQNSQAAAMIDELAASLAKAKLPDDFAVERVVSHAARQDRSILFVHVDWAPMKFQQKQLAEFIVAYQQRYPEVPIAFHYVDCTNSKYYASLKSLPGWQELSGGRSLIHGWGELVWMKKGRVLHVERIDEYGSAAKLIERTESLMGIEMKPPS
jgi:hypothetical protein